LSTVLPHYAILVGLVFEHLKRVQRMMNQNYNGKLNFFLRQCRRAEEDIVAVIDEKVALALVEKVALAATAFSGGRFGFGVGRVTSRVFDRRGQFGWIDSSNQSPNKGVGRGGGCRLPTLDPWAPEVGVFYEKVAPLRCHRFQHELTYLNENGWLCVNESAARDASYRDVSCTSRCFGAGSDDWSQTVGQWSEPFDRCRPVFSCEFVEVSCRAGAWPWSVYTNFHSQIVPKPKPLPTTERQWLSVLVLVLDSTSQSNLQRCFPKLVEALRANYTSVLLRGYAKVADNSFPNAVAAFTGKRFDPDDAAKSELPVDLRHEHFDHWPLIWRQFASRRQHVTLFAEDFPPFNLFTYQAAGFKQPPTDHYYRPFAWRVWRSFLHLRSTHLCVGNTPTHRMLLNYVGQFLRRYSDRPTFAIGWLAEITHDWLNQGQVADADLADFFNRARPFLTNTVTVLVSDHGLRFGDIRHTRLGRLEENMPAMVVALPDHAADRYPKLLETLQRNAALLATHYDLHATLLDLVDNGDTWTTLERRLAHARPPSTARRAHSLLLPLPQIRGCAEADIPDIYCVCQATVRRDNNETETLRAGQALVDELNHRLAGEQRCATLQLDRLLYAGELETDADHAQQPTSATRRYLIQVQTTPGSGHFEAIVHHRHHHRPQWTVPEDISRINRYGNQSFCVDNAVLKKYCFCQKN
ncbi:hypothetical protein T03_12864, partial [Trichinella britovi]